MPPRFGETNRVEWYIYIYLVYDLDFLFVTKSEESKFSPLFVTNSKINNKNNQKQPDKVTTYHNKTKMNTIIFAPPKRGGILQSSGFLDLQCLMSLNRTCKAHVFDELSLIQLIENEVTRYHGVRTMQEAIHFWRYIFGKPSLKRWLRRGSNSSNSNGATDSITVTRYMLSDASRYEVMLAKMLRAVPTQSERLQLVSELGSFGRTLLYRVAESGNTESLKAVLAIHPESEHLSATPLIILQDEEVHVEQAEAKRQKSE